MSGGTRWDERWRLDLTPADDRRRRMRYYTGIGHPYHLKHSPVPVFIAITTLMRYAAEWREQGDTWPVQSFGARWAGDCGAYAALMLARDSDAHPWSMDYRSYASTWATLVGKISHDYPGLGPDFIAIQDWPCEPSVRARTGMTVRQHQDLTLESFGMLIGEIEHLPWLPVLQGWELEEYLEHFEMYRAAGVDLADGRLVGIGSVCRRGSQKGIARIIRGLAPLGIRMHAFGLSINGLREVGHLLASSDSTAWSKTAREEHILLPGCDHRSRTTGEPTDCRNCFRYALAYREEILDAVRASWAAATEPRHEQLDLFAA